MIGPTPTTLLERYSADLRQAQEAQGATIERSELARRRLREDDHAARVETARVAIAARKAMRISLTSLDGWRGVTLKGLVLTEEGTADDSIIDLYVDAVRSKILDRLPKPAEA